MGTVARFRWALLRTAVARAWCAILTLAVLFGIAQAGTRYFYCEALGLSATDPCQATRAAPPCAPASLERTHQDCCQVITMPSMPSMPERARPVEPGVAPAALVALLPPALGGEVHASACGSRVAREGERWRGPPRASRERRAQLMVFQT